MTATLTAATTIRITGDRQRILAAIAAAETVAGHGLGAVNAHAELRPVEGGLAVSASDAIAGLTARVRGVAASGEKPVLVPARQVAMALRESASPEVEIAHEERDGAAGLAIHLADGEYHMPVLGDDVTLPPISGFPEAALATLPGAAFADLLARVSFAADRDRSSPICNGVLVQIEAGVVRMAATDGKVLAEAEHRDPAISAPEGGVAKAVIPLAGVALIERIVGAVDPEQVHLAFPGRLASIRLIAGDLTVDVTTRTVEGTFPAYAVAFAATADAPTITCDREALTTAVRRVSMLTDGASPALVIDVGPDVLRVRNLKTARGEGVVPVACTTTGKPGRYGFNHAYLTGVLRHHHGEQVVMQMGRGFAMPADGARFLVMPISLPD